jgi:hypothetical protein
MPPGIARPSSLLNAERQELMNAIQEAESLSALRAEIDSGVLEALRAEGYVRDDNGIEVADNDVLASRLREIVLRTRASTKAERQQKAVPRGTLAALAFPSVTSPSSSTWDPDDEVAEQVWKHLKGLVSRLTQTGRRGKVQQLLADDGLVLCPTKVGDDKVDAVYVTSDSTLILADFAVPRTSKLQNISEEVAQDFNLVIDRIPGMRKQMNSKLESGMKAAQIAARAKLALTAGSDDEDEI